MLDVSNPDDPRIDPIRLAAAFAPSR